MIKKTILELRNELDSNNISATDLTNECITYSKEMNTLYNPFVTIVDNPVINVSNSVLSGIPYSCKDLISTKGILTTGSSNTLKDYIPFFDATVVERLNKAGAVLTSKSVCDEFGLGGTCTTGHTGATLNPWNKLHQAGGSSGGSAAAVALGCVPFALGTDTGDSIRKPAAYCGVVGYKPTYGTISRYGVLPFASSLDHVGVFARCVKDASIVTDAVKGPDGKDMTCLPETDAFTPLLDGNVKGKKLFYIKELCDLSNYDNPSESLKETFKLFNESLDKARGMGIEVCEETIDIKLLQAIYPTYMIISCSEATSNLSMYTGIIYGPRGTGESINEIMKDHRSKGFSPLIKRRLVIGSYVLQKENQERYYLNACRVRRLIINTFNNLFTKYDGVIIPASGEEAPLLDGASDVINKTKTILENFLSVGNFGGYPSITIPNGFVNDMPIGVNITGKIMDDANILNIAYALEDAMPYKKQIVGGQNE